MPIRIVRNDITKMQVDAIVNAANETLLGGGGVDGCIHRAAGPELLAECRGLGGCATGSAKLTGAYRLPCRYVIHTVGPVWRGGGQGERELLASCYRTSLALAAQHGCESVAFPLISAGSYGYPKDEALRVADETIGAFLENHEMTVYIVVFDRQAYSIGRELYENVAACIDERYVEEHTNERASRPAPPAQAAPPGAAKPEPAGKMRSFFRLRPKKDAAPRLEEDAPRMCGAPPVPMQAAVPTPVELTAALEEELDVGFSETLLRLIDRSGMTDAQCYKKANIDRKLFSKIRSNPAYRPSKPTALAFAVALCLPLGETEALLRKAGFALTHASRFDIIVEYFIVRECWDVFAINEALFAFDQPLLGG